ncbi:MAG: TetR/AcrR family transcriptional regulator [Sphingomonadales bacterium]|jgi:AcrR family transcriptional regulator|nr:TetR/AcrR family transcriptional regulator [Sphingomonadales bacterium]
MILCSTIIVKGKEPDRHEARRSAIVAAARKAFLRDGYGQTSMSSIAADVGGSKTTLWNYFPSKEDLFAAVVDDQVERYGEALRLELPEDADLPETLTALGVSILTTILRPQIVALHRVVVGEAGRFPELGRMLWDRGAQRGQKRTEAWLRLQMDKGRLRAADPQSAASHFLGLCQSGSFYRHLLGASARPKRETIEAEIRLAVRIFLSAYRPDHAQSLAGS